jgi:RimJ/RimL family protein N-acetyltransferase
MAEVRLRPIRISDAEKCFRWVSHPEVFRYLGFLQPARTLEQERSWIASILSDPQHQRAFVIEDEREQEIGTCGLRAMDRQEGTALLGIMIGDPRRWGRGYGTAATKALLQYAFEELGLREVRLSCHAENKGAIRCYEKAGFELRSRSERQFETRREEVFMVIGGERWRAVNCPDTAARPEPRS